MLYEREVVPVKTLQSVFVENGIISTDVLKLDCEGYDYDIILSALTYFKAENKKFPCIVEFEAIVHPGEGDEMLHFAKVLNLTLASGYNAVRYFYNVQLVAEEVAIESDNSKVYGLHRDCPSSRIDELEYLLDDDLHDARLLCQPVFDKFDDTGVTDFERLCPLLTFKGNSSKVLVHRCFHGQCV